ncbi:MAG: DUF4474 domain-containing protein [Clostridia bacterium]|nr:DUF4474 domain-containing protein [Clostridia bacterium]
MNLKKAYVKVLSVFLVVVSLFGYTAIASYCAEPEASTDTSEGTSHVLVLTSDSLSVKKGKKVQLHASVSNTETQPEITWSSSDTSIATVDENGSVKGIAEGKVIIFATAEIDGTTLSGEFALNVVKKGNFIQDFLTERQVLSYQYSYVDDYYYTNDKQAWQYNFGFGKIYDIASPYILLEYDYIRVFFEYEGKDWMIQMWKGQYGMIFYGGEIGVYNRPHSEDGVHEWTMYNCPAEEDWLMMEMTVYHQDINGNYIREFTRKYDKYWWCTGFKNGHLRQEEPADELRLEARVTFKSPEMRELFTQGLSECGFGISESKEAVGLDQYYADGSDVYFVWQNISDAESTMGIKVGVGLIASIIAIPYLPAILPFAGFFIILVILASAIV